MQQEQCTLDIELEQAGTRHGRTEDGQGLASIPTAMGLEEVMRSWTYTYG